jgi:hypothetical protein
MAAASQTDSVPLGIRLPCLVIGLVLSPFGLLLGLYWFGFYWYLTLPITAIAALLLVRRHDALCRAAAIVLLWYLGGVAALHVGALQKHFHFTAPEVLAFADRVFLVVVPLYLVAPMIRSFLARHNAQIG